jgi:hypothetical protein
MKPVSGSRAPEVGLIAFLVLRFPTPRSLARAWRRHVL